MLGFALNAYGFTAFVRIRIRENNPGIQTDLSIQPAISMRRKPKMVFLKQQNVAYEVLRSVGWVRKMFFQL